jgi:hypothetical protein
MAICDLRQNFAALLTGCSSEVGPDPCFRAIRW